MANLQFEANDDTYSMMKRVLANYHPDVVDFVDDIAIIFKEKASKSGGMKLPCKTLKAPKLLESLGKKSYKFIFEIAQDIWSEMDDSQREATLDRCLCACHVEYDEKNNEYKYSVKKPDLSVFSAELLRRGVWWKDLDLTVKSEDEEESTSQKKNSEVQEKAMKIMEDMFTEQED